MQEESTMEARRVMFETTSVGEWRNVWPSLQESQLEYHFILLLCVTFEDSNVANRNEMVEAQSKVLKRCESKGIEDVHPKTQELTLL